MKIGFIIPAKLSSTRLPRKNLMYLGSQTALEWAIDRASRANGIDEVIVATTSSKDDVDVTKLCIKKQIRYFLGDKVDILKRYRDTVEFFDFDYMINITPDNTLFSVYLIDRMIAEIKSNRDADYLYFEKITLGSGLYALKKEALQTICEFKDIIDTEIWGSLFQDKYFNVVALKTPKFLQSDYRLTLDTPEDYKMLAKIYSDLEISPTNLVDLSDVIWYLNEHKEIAKINSNIQQRSLASNIVDSIKRKFEEHETEFYQIKRKFYRK